MEGAVFRKSLYMRFGFCCAFFVWFCRKIFSGDGVPFVGMWGRFRDIRLNVSCWGAVVLGGTNMFFVRVRLRVAQCSVVSFCSESARELPISFLRATALHPRRGGGVTLYNISYKRAKMKNF